MKPVFEKIRLQESASFLARKFETDSFDAPFHFHPEYELTLILKGEGQRYVGQQVNNFQVGDLVFLGSNLPHCWISQSEPNETVAAIVVQFDTNFLGKDFMFLPETLKIHEFLEKSKSGFEILDNAKMLITEKLLLVPQQNPLERMIALLEILAILSHQNDLLPIDFSFYKHPYTYHQTARFQKIFSYLIANFREEISLEKIAEVADLSPTSFCRYFKNITQKTFIQILLEYRIEFACQLLLKTEMPVQAVVFESGFSDIPYFNKVFKKYKGVSPLVYRKQKSVV